MTHFTVVLPTTGDRGPLLPLIVGQLQLQSVRDWELFIIGDGVTAETRRMIESLTTGDSRIRFFDHPKHPRRGEIYRHEALQQAAGRHVAYLCDRDLWFHDHLESLAGALEEFDFAHTHRFTVNLDGTLTPGPRCDLERPAHRSFVAKRHSAFGLSSVGHTLAAYRRLPHGWRTTPSDFKTDHYMWMQFLNDPGCRAASVPRPTVLYFHRGEHPGWATARRLEELLLWQGKVATVAGQEAVRSEAMNDLRRPWPRVRHWILSELWWHRSAFLAIRRSLNVVRALSGRRRSW